MATLVLTAIGTAVAGPLGGALGAVFGQQVDQRLFAPRSRQGARLGDLTIQTSTYGRRIPRIFGRMRVSGTVIWASDLRENRQTQSQGKGRPKTTTYSYSASFAVALSARPARQIGRIWADGKLLRGAAGDLKVATGFRFYAGTEDQSVDPLIAAAEGADRTPAYRGLCYALFEDMALESFGNRIPHLSFEIIADEAPVSIGDVLSELGDGAWTADSHERVTGLVADGPSIRSVVEPLAEVLGLRVLDGGQTVRLSMEGQGFAVDSQALGARAGLWGGPTQEHRSLARAQLPNLVRLGYADPARDYQPGIQMADMAAGALGEPRDLPLAMEAVTAQHWAWQSLLTARASGETMTVSLPWRYLTLLGGGQLAVPGDSRPWRIRAIRFEAMRLEIDLAMGPATPPHMGAADGGRSQASPDLVSGQTRLMLVELPWLEAGVAPRPVVAVAAAGTSPGWRKASLLQSNDDGSSWSEIGETMAPATIGVTQDVLGPACAGLFDRRSSLTVTLLHDDMGLASVDEDGLLAGRNMMLVGRELIQFGRAERLGPTRYRLSHLLRGRRGTEAEMDRHQAGEEVLLLDRTTLLTLDTLPDAGPVRIAATGLGDSASVERTLVPTGIALRPLSPVRPIVRRLADGATSVTWVRRSREGWAWPDMVDAPLAEEEEVYRLTASPDRGVGWEEQVSAATYILTAARMASMRAAGAAGLTLTIVQLGRLRASLPLTVDIPLA